MPTAGGRNTPRNDEFRDRSIRYLVWIALLAGCSLALIRVILTLPLHVPLNYNEGWNAYHVADVMARQSPYRTGRPYFFNNYPPLSFYLVAAATRFVDDPIVAGRWLAFASFGVWTVALAFAAASFGCRREYAWFGALVIAATTLVFTDYVGIDDPQMLGHALAAVGLIVLLRASSGASSLLIAAVLFVVAAFVKQNLVVLPMASVLWLAYVDRRRAWLLAVSLIVLAALTGAVCVAAFGPAFVQSLTTPRAVLPLKGAWMAIQWLLRSMVLVILAMLLLLRYPRDSAVIFVSIYAGVAAAAGAAFGAGAGVNWNVFFDADWAVCLAGAVALERLGEGVRIRGGLRPATAIMAACLMIPLIATLAAARSDRASWGYWIGPRSAETADAARQIAFLRAHTGPVMCEDLALCFWSGKSAEVDVFNTQQQILLGRIDEQPLLAQVERGRFAAIQVDVPARDISPAISTSISRTYRIDHEAFNRVFLLPRSAY